MMKEGTAVTKFPIRVPILSLLACLVGIAMIANCFILPSAFGAQAQAPAQTPSPKAQAQPAPVQTPSPKAQAPAQPAPAQAQPAAQAPAQTQPAAPAPAQPAQNQPPAQNQAPAPEQAQAPFTFQNVIDIAKKTAADPYKSTEGNIPPFLLNITYDQWRDIRFQPDKSLWRSEKLPFEVQFFHAGFYYNRTIQLNVVDKGVSTRFSFTPDLFHYGMNQFKDQIPNDLGFAGFRIHYALNRPDYMDEVAVFLGASYFRALAKGQHYGLSARGLAIDTALPSGEDFPYFREFWLEKPAPDAKQITLYALMDSPFLAGAYKYTIKPGEATVMDVESVLFRRKDMQKLGVAPLTSMFFYGENTNIRPIDDFRPEVHDSDGLAVVTGTGEWIWRALSNPSTLLVTSFQTKNPAAFGLFQRDLNFSHYQDLEAYYHNRPSVWIVPSGQWGKEGLNWYRFLPTRKSTTTSSPIGFRQRCLRSRSR